jgi:hypothetical protein
VDLAGSFAIEYNRTSPLTGSLIFTYCPGRNLNALSRGSFPATLRRLKSFNGRLRDELLNETLFTWLVQVRAVLTAWKDD